MSRRLIDIYYDTTNLVLLDSSGNILPRTSFPVLRYRELSLINLRLVTGSDMGAYTSLESDTVFEATVDDSFASSSVMCKTLDAGINVAGDWLADSAAQADMTQGEISIKMNADTTGFRDTIGTDAEVPATMLGIKASNPNGEIIDGWIMDIRTLNVVGDSSAVPSEVSDNFEWFTDPATGAQCLRIVNDNGEVLQILSPPGV